MCCETGRRACDLRDGSGEVKFEICRESSVAPRGRGANHEYYACAHNDNGATIPGRQPKIKKRPIFAKSARWWHVYAEQKVRLARLDVFGPVECGAGGAFGGIDELGVEFRAGCVVAGGDGTDCE